MCGHCSHQRLNMLIVDLWKRGILGAKRVVNTILLIFVCYNTAAHLAHEATQLRGCHKHIVLPLDYLLTDGVGKIDV